MTLLCHGNWQMFFYGPSRPRWYFKIEMKVNWNYSTSLKEILLNSVGGMGGLSQILAWVAWVHKILACLTWVKILAWVAWVHIQMKLTCVSWIFKLIFEFVFVCLFLKLWLSLCLYSFFGYRFFHAKYWKNLWRSRGWRKKIKP